MTCTAAGCQRARMTSSGGWRYALCEAHVRDALASFGEPVSWWERAARHTLPPRITGGLPVHPVGAGGVPPFTAPGSDPKD